MRLLVRLLIAAISIGAICLGVGYFLVLSPNTPDFEGERSVKIPRGAKLDAVVDSLSARGIVKRGATFRTVAKLTGWGSQIKAGHYEIPSGSSNYDLLQTLRRGLQKPVRVTIPPGTTKSVIAAVVAREMAFSKDDFLKALSDPELAAEIDTDTTRLFAYLMPETYFFYWLTDAKTVITKIKNETESFVERKRTENGGKSDLTIDEVLSVAGIVEWETAHVEEKGIVAGVYLNRLRDGWALQADPTVQYAILETEGAKRRLFFKDYDIDHPYNTYRYAGLPPGPITNPSPTSIEAVLRPEEHDYYYFVARGDGTHIFSRTLSQHRRAAQEYYRLMNERRRQQSAAN